MWEFEIGKNICLLGAAPEKPQQPGRDALEQHRLANNQDDRGRRVDFNVMEMEVLEPPREIMENEKEISGHENRVDRELGQEGPQRLCFLFLGRRNAGHPSHFAVGLAVGRACLQSAGRFLFAPEGFLSTFQFAFSRRIWPTPQTNTPKTFPDLITSMTSASTVIFAARPRRPITNATTTAATPSFTNSLRAPRKRRFARKRWKVVRSRPSATTAGSCSRLAQSRRGLEITPRQNSPAAP